MKYLVREFSSLHKLVLMFADAVVFFIVHLAFMSFVDAPPLLSGLFALLSLSSLYVFGAYDLFEDNTLKIFTTRMGYAFATSILGLFALSIATPMDAITLLPVGFGFFALSSAARMAVFEIGLKTRRDMKWLFLVSADYLPILKADLEKNHFSGQATFLTQEKTSLYDTWENFDYYKNQKWSAIVVVAPHALLSSEVSDKLMNRRMSGQAVWDAPHFYEKMWKRLPVYFVQDSWFVVTESFNLVNQPVKLRMKRFLDLALALTVLAITWPFMIITALAVMMESKGGAFYRQIRVGKNGRKFTIYKFRSMAADAEKNGAQWAAKNDVRVTRVGKIIRLTRLDELPQLFNVIKGDMSFVGPRPERPELIAQICKEVPHYNVRHLVRPGITGWAQILYPYGASIEDAKEKLQLDLYHIKNYSFLLDIIIVLKTISIVVLRKGR